jgi:hypothetical protein
MITSFVSSFAAAILRELLVPEQPTAEALFGAKAATWE